MLPRPTIEAFDAWLAARSLRLDAIVVGGSALALLGVTDRQTRDFDILHPELPEEIAEAAREFAAHLRNEGVELADDWLNNGPMQLADVLPDGVATSGAGGLHGGLAHTDHAWPGRPAQDQALCALRPRHRPGRLRRDGAD